MNSTYDNIIGVAGSSRACILCGAMGFTRNVLMSKIPPFQTAEPQQTPLCRTFLNMRESLRNEQNKQGAYENTVPMCVPCVHWSSSHQTHGEYCFIAHYLQEFLRTLTTPDGVCFDRRTVLRMCKCLTATWSDRINVYLPFFDSRQQNLLKQIAKTGTVNISNYIAQYFQQCHNNMLFAPNRRISEFLREFLVNNDNFEAVYSDLALTNDDNNGSEELVPHSDIYSPASYSAVSSSKSDAKLLTSRR